MNRFFYFDHYCVFIMLCLLYHNSLFAGLSQGRPVDWMDARGEEMTMWQAMLDRPNIWIDGTLILRPNMEKRKF